MQNYPESNSPISDLQQYQRADGILNAIDLACYELDSNFNFLYMNAKAEEVFRKQIIDIFGLNVWSVFPEFVNTGCYTAINMAIIDKQASTHEFVSGFTHQWVSLSTIPTAEGAIVMFKEINEAKVTKAKLQEEQRRLEIAQEVVKMGYFKRRLNNQTVYWSDELYQLLGLEPQSEQITLEKIIKHIHPDDRESFRQHVEKVSAEHQPFEMTYRIVTPKGEVRILIERGAFLKDENGIVNRIHGLVQDITEQQQAKQELKESEELLKSIFDTSLIGMAIFKAVYNENGTVEDFRIVMVNKELERETRRTDFVGKLCSKDFPGLRKVRLFDMMLRVMETGKPEQREYNYQQDSFDKWFSCMFVKKDNDGLVATHLDITQRKLAEQEKFKNYLMLQQSEKLAKSGTWEYEHETGKFAWSDGMYRIFGLEKGTVVKPEIYLEYATAENLAVAERIVGFIKEGTTCFEERLHINVQGEVEILRVKGMVASDEAGKISRMIGVDLDVTEPIKLRLEKQQLEMEQMELQASQNRRIFLATLTAQEEERKRIAESLHNGLGQILYGVKLSLDQLNLQTSTLDMEGLKQAKQQTDNLLAEAIKEARRISHELTPTILEDFGLKEAVKDICQQLRQGVAIQCTFVGSAKRLSKHIETAIYRTVQELVLNVVKHAKATEAFVTIEINNEAVSLTVRDNGIGFNSDHQRNGIGLKTIQNKVKLLKGTYEISSGKGEDTVISIRIPYV